MDNPTRWNITNSAQNIVSALVDPSKQYDSVFRRDWNNTFAGFARPVINDKTKLDIDFKAKLKDYVGKLEARQSTKSAQSQQRESGCSEKQPGSNGQITGVPEIFMHENFDLSNPDTFNTVIGIADSSYSSVNAKITEISGHMTFDSIQRRPATITKSQLRELQQCLTDFLDVIEDKLASQISVRSGDFFQVMSSVDCVMDELSLAIKSVTQLRRKCTKLNENMMLPNMKSININGMRNNAQEVLDKLNDMAYLCKVQPMIQILLSASDFVGALDLIAKSRVMLHRNLNQVISLRYMESQLNEIERMIGTMMQQEFLTLISSEWDCSLNQQTSAASRLSKLFDYFAHGHSEIPDRGSLTLLSLLQIQAEKFVNQFHEERKKRVESSLDVERWKTVDVPTDFQILISMIIDDKLRIGDIFSRENLQQIILSESLSRNTSTTSLILDTTGKIRQNGSNQRTKLTSDSASFKDSLDLALKKTDIIQEQYMPSSQVRAAGCTFVIVDSVIILIRTVMDYCKCAHDIRSLSADLLERLFKVLQLYNSKTYHLVYSAGAVQVAGLKTITTRSLIVSQRSLKLITLFLPAIHKHFSQLLPNDNRLKRFDEIKALYDEHVEKIPERVKSIVKDIIDLQLTEWEAKPPVPSTQFNFVTQHLIRLHDNIQDILPQEEIKELLGKIHEAFINVLIRHLHRLNIRNEPGPQQWLVTQELTFYRITLSKLKIFSEMKIDFDHVWRDDDDLGVSNGSVETPDVISGK